MALITCPDCGAQVSDRAKTCIHCGAPLIAEPNIVTIRTPKGEGVVVKVTYTITDDNTGKVLATATQNQVVSFELNEATTLRCHCRGGFKDGIISYSPKGKTRYQIALINTFFNSSLNFQEVDSIDADY